MTISEGKNQALSRNEALVTEILKIIDILPDFIPFKGNIQEQLNNLRSAIQGLRPPRIMVIGRCKAGVNHL